MRHPVDGKYNAIAYAKEASAGADEDRSVAVLDGAGDQLRLEQMRFSQWVDLPGGEEEETCICANPETSVTVWKYGADSVAGGFDPQQVVMKCVAVVTIDAVEPGAYPNVPAPVFGECADGGCDRHSRRIGGEEMPVVPAEEAFAPGAEPGVAVAVCE